MMELNGVYNDKDIYVQNNFADNGSFCTKEIKVNGKIIRNESELRFSAFHIELRSLGLKMGDKVHIEITYEDKSPKVLNPSALELVIK